ncbi:hypothetical protein A2W14_05855 [Candidatus Gottesmanbacteria bacterium RBG_16_37_8]|uniref:Uncharacterized protein n=1 Tax=Candidatus Gottesmanbacteria bacterium RBG_16_37_8 TaxID=1798371 RepID=A0A1F5YUW6_9BACT|nr:MAG: hypothetical protein A2W14_05855 [Candidatus Gottesmanbacteria bacterium RBG_16_37_8]
MNNKENLEYYSYLYKLVLHESKAVWDTGQLFLLSNAFLAAIIGTNFGNNSNDWRNQFIFWLLALLGLVISLLWLLSFNRTKNYYHFRMAQAKKMEKNLFEIFSGDGERIANGESIKINGKEYSLKICCLNLSSLTIVNIVIFVFIIFYLIVCVLFFPINN